MHGCINYRILGSADLKFGLTEQTFTYDSESYTEQVGTVTAGKLYDIRIDGQSIVTPDGVNDYYPFVEQIVRGSVATGTIIGLSADDYSSGTSTTFIYNVDGERIGATGVPAMSEMEALIFRGRNWRPFY